MASGQVAVPVRVKGSSKCAFHRNKDVLLHCSDCNILICLTCSLSTHQGHGLVELADITPQRKVVLQSFINNTEDNYLVRLQKEIDSIEKKLRENGDKFEECCRLVKQQGELCKQQIDVLIDEYVSTCNKLAEENRQMLIQYKDELKKRHTSILEQVKDCKEVLQTGNSVNVYDETSTVSTEALGFPDEPVLREVGFRPSGVVSEQLRNVLGILATSPSPVPEIRTTSEDTSTQRSVEELPSNAVRHVATPKEEQPTVSIEFRNSMLCSSICPTASGVWLSHRKSRELLLVDFKGQQKQKIKNSDYIESIAISPKTNNVWFVAFGDHSFGDLSFNEVVTGSKSPIARFSVETSMDCFCVTREDNVVVCTSRKTKIYSREGRELHSGDLGKNYTSPNSVSECPVTSNLAVVYVKGKDDEWRIKVVVRNKTLGFMFDYSGDRSDGQSACYPWYVVYENRGNMLLVTLFGAIELVSGTGQHLRTIDDTRRFGITAVGMQSGGDVLWICCRVDKRGMVGKITNAEESHIRGIKYYKKNQ
ncbi:uncharacterized protein LOC117325910 [Pecten maximus]|uniref:uncharacterized protein LOC117325910 n=1 Tax=Pecten maximus TaxID=6579 RepID=UPI001458CF32|nr:uncharacterized protein LOC117325910 [Pecten maximus]